MGKIIFIDVDGTLLDYENKYLLQLIEQSKKQEKMDIMYIFGILV